MFCCSIVSATFRTLYEKCVGSSSYESNIEFAISEGLSMYSRNRVASATQLRSAFAEYDLVHEPVVAGHTHGKSAASRSTASAFIDTIAPSVGYRAVYLQGSAADSRRGRVYTRHYRWGKDLNVEPSQVEKQEMDLTAMVDVDYYVDMPDHLGRHFRPVLLYTFQPSKAAKGDGEYKYTFKRNNEVEYLVSGGGSYEHKVWNWKGDSVASKRYFCCIPISYSIFSVERKQVDADHQLVLLAPLRKFVAPYSWLAQWRAKCEPVTRLEPVDGDFIRLKTNGPTGLMVSTAKVGAYSSSTVLASVDEAIASTAITCKHLTHAQIKSKMGHDTSQGSEVLYEYHLKGNPRAARVDLVAAVRSFQWVKKLEDYEPEPSSMDAFMEPIVDGAFIPDNCRNNDDRMKEARVERLTAEGDPPLTTKIRGFIYEFAEILHNILGELQPVDIDEVYVRQSRPTQRRILDEAQHTLPDSKASAMQKAEAYANVKDPRAITIIHGNSKMRYSSFIYSVADAMKRESERLPWYAFGRTPKDIANRVAEIGVSVMKELLGSDFERQDGRIKSNARFFEKVLMQRLFPTAVHNEMLQCMREHIWLKVKTRYGATYSSKLARASGGADTSLFNTLLNALIHYCAFRMTRVDGAFMTPLDAWNSLGVYAGDDGLTADVAYAKLREAAKAFGQVITYENFPRGESGVNFLARYYSPDVWHGDTNSCCDLKRQLSKFHTTTRLPSNVTPQDKLTEKAFAFWLTDRNSPIIGPMVSIVLKIFPVRSFDKFRTNIYIQTTDVNAQYPNQEAEWMYDLLEKQIPTFNLDLFENWITGVTAKTFFSTPHGLFAEAPLPVVKEGIAVCDGEVVEPSAPTVQSGTEAPKKKRYRPRKPHNKQKQAPQKRNTARS